MHHSPTNTGLIHRNVGWALGRIDSWTSWELIRPYEARITIGEEEVQLKHATGLYTRAYIGRIYTIHNHTYPNCVSSH